MEKSFQNFTREINKLTEENEASVTSTPKKNTSKKIVSEDSGIEFEQTPEEERINEINKDNTQISEQIRQEGEPKASEQVLKTEVQTLNEIPASKNSERNSFVESHEMKSEEVEFDKENSIPREGDANSQKENQIPERNSTEEQVSKENSKELEDSISHEESKSSTDEEIKEKSENSELNIEGNSKDSFEEEVSKETPEDSSSVTKEEVVDISVKEDDDSTRTYRKEDDPKVDKSRSFTDEDIAYIDEEDLNANVIGSQSIKAKIEYFESPRQFRCTEGNEYLRNEEVNAPTPKVRTKKITKAVLLGSQEDIN